jgi:hypothetical protein
MKETLVGSSRFFGFAAYGEGDDAIAIAVLPKVWGWHAEDLCIDWNAGPLYLALHENQRCTIHADSASKLASIEKLVAACSSDAPDSVGAEHRRLIARAQNHVLARRVPCPPWEVDGLAALMLLHERTMPESEGVADSMKHPVLVPITHRAYVNEAKKRFSEFRRSYREHEEAVSTIRGRVIAGSLALEEARGGSGVRCRFEDFTHFLPLYQVVVTALDVVARGTWYDAAGSSAWKNEAKVLRRALASLPSLPLSEARKLASAIRLERGFRAWERVLKLALAVLESSVPFGRAGGDSGIDAPCVWTVSSSMLWQRMLVELVSPYAMRVDTQFRAPPPWGNDRNPSQPDLLVSFAESPGWDWILDAKYGKAKHTPERQYQYQLFAYAHLVPNPRNLALVHPAATETSIISGPLRCRGLREHLLTSNSFQELLRTAPQDLTDVAATMDRQLRLFVFAVEFPSPNAILDPPRWSDWKARTSQMFMAKLDQASTAHD